MEDLLQLDLNEVVSKKVAKKLEVLDNQIKGLNDTITAKSKRIQELEGKIKEDKEKMTNAEFFMEMMDIQRQNFEKINKSNETDGDWYDSKQKNQYKYLAEILKNNYGIDEEYGGWHSSRSDGSLISYLAVNFHSNKDVVARLYQIVNSKATTDEVHFLKNFKMPFEWEKRDILEFAKNPQYNTNGCMFGKSRYWVEHGLGKKNCPYDLVFKHPSIMDDDVFDAIIDTMKNKRTSNCVYMYRIPEYANVTEDRIQQIGRTLIGIKEATICYDIERFVAENLKDLDSQTLDYLFSMSTSDNKFKKLHWAKFPKKYQEVFLMTKTFDQAMNLMVECMWTNDEKKEFLRKMIIE